MRATDEAAWEAIASLSRQALAADALPTLFDAAASVVATALGVDYAMVLESLPGSAELLVRAGHGWRAEVLARATIPAGRESQAGYALERGEPVVTPDLSAENRFVEARLLRAWGARSGISVPIAGRNHTFGVISAHAASPRSFSGRDAAIVRTVANVLADAIDAVERRARNRALGTISTLLAEAPVDCEGLLDATAQILVPSFGDVAVIDLLQPDGRIERRAVGASSGAGRRLLGALLDRPEPEADWPWPVGQVMTSGTFRHAQAPPSASSELVERRPDHVAAVGAAGIAAFLTVPLIARGRTLGTVSLAYHEPGRSYGPPDVELAQVVARRIATGLDTLRLLEAERAARQEAERALAIARASEQAEKLRALGQMASGIAHDLNQTLGLVVGHAELALRALEEKDPALDEVGDSLSTLFQAGLDGAATVRRLLTFARGREEGDPVPTDLAALVRDVAQFTAPRWRDGAQAEGRPIRLEIDAPAPATVLGWPASLREALTNLIFNAVDALPGGGDLKLSVRRAADRVHVEVADTGVGMSEEVRARAFEPFFTTKGSAGTGLGLAMVHAIVGRHGGEVEIASAPGQGTVFRLLLPATEPAAGAGERDGGVVHAPRRILVVDDEVGLTRLAARMLEQAGHRVATAASGEEAIERMSGQVFDVVVTDLGLGAGMNGWELTAEIRQRWPTTGVALATGWGAAIDPARARELGAGAVVAKPYRQVDLCRAVAAVAPPAPAREETAA
ncbi:MAG TPA: GAF domain-containing protein [Chloroflexota bacterium]|jgi:signal transduction histidine kinase/ActR/RegA family two-component response regulator/putative methionine-R-sulfoxide reductase with GAF domain